MNSWLILAFAILCEVSATSSLKYAAVSENKMFIIAFAVLMAASFALVYQAVKTIDLGVAYAIWAGLGLVLVTCVSFVLFKEQVSVVKIICIGLILAGVVGLKYISAKA